jgi:hypothetical protein
MLGKLIGSIIVLEIISVIIPPLAPILNGIVLLNIIWFIFMFIGSLFKR